MLKTLARKLITREHWEFVSWYRDRFGIVAAVAAYVKFRWHGVARAPNPMTGGSVKLRPGTADQNVYDEIFVVQEYDLDLGDPSFIVDAGAHVGFSSVFFACKYPQATVIAIEPEPSNFDILSRNVEQFHNIKPIMAGLWSKKTCLRIQDPDAPTWSFRVVEDSSGKGIPALGIMDIMHQFGVTYIDVLKIDIEGAELELLNRSQSWLSAIGTIIVELHDRFQPGCTEALYRALSGFQFDQSRSGESVIINNLKTTES